MLSQIKNIHFLGICGTAMGSVAAALKDEGYRVTGSDDNIYPPMSDFLGSRGLKVSAPFSADNIPLDAELIVVGNAISRGNPEVEEVLNRKLLYFSLPETLKEFFLRGRHNLVVTGTHGKTTTTSLLAWIFERAGREPGYLIGGVPNNLGQGGCLRRSKYFVIEGDEYDTAFFDKRSKFLHYLPELLVINNIEFDHADIFANLEEITTSFRRLVNIVPQNGMVLFNADDHNSVEVVSKSTAPTVGVGFSESAANRITDARYSDAGSAFRLFDHVFELHLAGEFNVRNAAMCISAAHFYGIGFDVIKDAVATFTGVKRRQEERGTPGGRLVIDDFGHHPTAIRNTLAGLRQKYPGRRQWAVFEPRSNTSRRAIFQQSLPEALSVADGIVLAPVARPESLAPAERLDVERVVESLREAGREAYCESGVEAIVARLKGASRTNDVIIVFSNGGFGGIHEKLLDALATAG
jgi:UDP-N-acetylmuramate: L-alanyl-gamma-D-glutamyl-meso-diaminopimelate ligase